MVLQEIRIGSYVLTRRELARRILVGLVAVSMFVVAVRLLGESTGALSPVIRGLAARVLSTDASALGLGWFSSYVMLNGSTVTAVALGLFDAGVVTEAETFLLVAGSRLGAAFLVVLIGFLGYVRGVNESLRDSCSVGVLSFIVAYSVYLPATALGYGLLVYTDAGFLALEVPAAFRSLLDVLYGPVVALLAGAMGPVPLFASALLVLVGSLKVFDLAFAGLGRHRIRDEGVEKVERWVFSAGAALTLVTASVTLSLGILVPLYNERFFERRRALVPYMLGANLTTLVDTAFAAAVLLLGLSATAVTMALLLLYRRYLRVLGAADGFVLGSRRGFVFFIAATAALPLALILL
ncbi:MAG: hypothetical protein MAG715_00034 [Methanonatronarchaeales archaeon]|nr:hypothetical protein [Methanonatronarchaeales archaeon]